MTKCLFILVHISRFSLVELCCVFIGVGLANKLLFQSSKQICQMLRLEYFRVQGFEGGPGPFGGGSSTFVRFVMAVLSCACIFYVCVCLHACVNFSPSRPAFLGRRCEKENCFTKDHRARKEEHSG